MSKNRVIGVKNQLPWKIPEDLRRFKAITLGHPIIMGRKTFESIGRVLPGRENIIISRQPDLTIPGAQVVASLAEAIRICENKTDEAFVIGGAEIYALALPYLHRVYLTLINQEIEGDAFFPEGALDQFQELSREDRSEPLPYSFIVLEKSE